MKLGLHIIAKDELGQIDRILQAYSQYFDYVEIAIDAEDAYYILKDSQPDDSKVRVFHYTDRMPSGRIDFGKKRNFLAKHSKADWYFRLDTDDEIMNPELIRESAEKAEHDGIDVLTCYYDYSRDEHGNTNMAHWRETIVHNNGKFFWNKPIHECLIPFNKFGFKIDRSETIKIKHLIDAQHSKESVKRNIAYLEEEWERDKQNTDSRTLAYLGRSYYGIGDFKKSLFFLEQHIKTSGWAEDRYMSWCTLSQIFNLHKNYRQAMGAAFEAIQECPDFPDAYFQIHDIYYNQSEWAKAVDWALQGFKRPTPQTNIFIDPSQYTWRPMLSLADSYFQLGEFEKAVKTLDEAKRYVPQHDYIKSTAPIYEQALEHSRFVTHFMWLYHYLKDKDSAKLQSLVKTVPKELELHDILIRARNEVLEPRKWQENEIAIFAASVNECWYPDSEKTGIGGSEEAVINLSRELTKLGWKITVYNNCGDHEGTYEGIDYVNTVKFNARDDFNILISWRTNIFVSDLIHARRCIVWLHDLPQNIEWANGVDKLVVLSNYHASLLGPVVPKQKVYVSTNGINISDFSENGVLKQPKRIIYASSYNRGLETILRNWPRIRAEVPEAELHIYYGWDVYDQYVEAGWIKDTGWKASMVAMMNQPGVFEHGRVGHKELADAYKQSEFFAYPSTYEGEINCIALTKAVAAGCKCITNDRYALKERNPHIVVSDDSFIPTLIKTLKGELPCPDVDLAQYLEQNSWESVARDWHKNVLSDETPTALLHKNKWIASHFDEQLDKDLKIIDIGANRGHTFSSWPSRQNVTSVDIDEYNYEGFVRADACDLPFSDKQFDKALMAETLEHVPNPIKALSEVNRVSKHLILTVPYEYDWDEKYRPFHTLEKEMEERQMTAEELAKFGNPEAKDFHKDGFKHLYHQTFYTPELLADHLKQAGFKEFTIKRLRHGGISWLGVDAL